MLSTFTLLVCNGKSPNQTWKTCLMRTSSMTDEILLESRQICVSVPPSLDGFGIRWRHCWSCRFAYLHDKDLDKEVDLSCLSHESQTVSISQRSICDQQIGQHLKPADCWALDLVEKSILRLGIYEMTEFDTPQTSQSMKRWNGLAAFSDETSSRFYVLSQFRQKNK